MCLTLELLVAFLNVIGPEAVSQDPGRFIIHAETGDVAWVEVSDTRWCTMGPQIDRIARFDAL